MTRNTVKLLTVTLMILSLAACKTARKTDEEGGDTSGSEINSANIPVNESGMGDSDSGKAMGLQTIYFGYDNSSLTAEMKKALASNADILKGNKSLKVQIEGHCDARGGIQYNIALGEKRAHAVKRYLETMGVSGSRVSTISYGKERLVAQGESEEAHARNRRANFVITGR